MSQKVILQPDENGQNPTVNIGDVNQSVMTPVNVSYHESTTIQTHNAVSVATVSWSVGSWIDVSGYTQISGTVMNNATTTFNVQVQWSNDGSTEHGIDQVINNNTLQYGTFNTPTKARYARVSVYNGDTVAHTMSAWVYLMA